MTRTPIALTVTALTAVRVNKVQLEMEQLVKVTLIQQLIQVIIQILENEIE